MWAKISNSATSMACAACIVVAATLPWAGSAAERVATEDLRLAAITDIDAFSAIPSYLDILFGTPAQRAAAVAALDSINGLPGLLAFLGGDPDLLFGDKTNPGYDALSAIDIFFGDGANHEGGVISDGNFDGLSNYDALSALPAYRTLLDPASTTQQRLDALGALDSVSAIPVFVAAGQAAAAGDFVSTCTTDAMNVTTCTPSVASALGGYDALSALDTFFGDGPDGQGGVFTGGGINALAPDADGNGGYAALSALPVFFGTATGPFGAGVFVPGGGIGALRNYDALSGIPEYLNAPPNTKIPPPTTLAVTNAAPQQQLKVADDPAPTTTTPPATNPVTTFVAALPKPKDFTPPAPQAITPPAPPKEEPKVEAAAATTTDNGGSNQQNVTRNSNKFTPKGIGGDNPLLFGSGTPGVDNGIRGWGDGLKKLGIGSTDSSSDGTG